MSAQPAGDRHLQAVDDAPALIVVDPVSGERVGMLADLMQGKEDEIAGLQRDVRGWTTRHAELKRDKEGEARDSAVWPAALRVFDYWRRVCKHPRSEFSLDRFEMIRPHLERLSAPKKGRPDSAEDRLAHAEAVCQLAVDGIAFDPYVTTRKNGTQQRHDGWHLIFETVDNFEKRCNAAPIERIREVMGKPKAEQTTLDQPQEGQ